MKKSPLPTLRIFKATNVINIKNDDGLLRRKKENFTTIK